MNKPTLIAVAVFGVLLLAFVATREKQVAVGVQKFEVPAFKADQLTAVEISGANTARLVKDGATWTVADPAKPDAKFSADESQVNGLLSALAEFKAADFVSEKSEKHAEFEVDSAKGVTVKATAGAQTLEFVLGKASKSGGTYVRKPGANAVFSTNSGLPYQVKRNVSAWRNKTITTLPSAELAKLSVTQADGATYALKAGEGTWALESAAPAGFRFDASVGQRLASQLSSLTAQDFIEGETVDFSKGVTVSLAQKDGKTQAISVGEKRPDGNVPLRVEGNPQLYLIASWQAEQLTRRLEDLRDTSLLDFDPDQVNRVTITAAGKKTVVAKEGDAWKLVEPKVAPAGVTFDATQVVVQLRRWRGIRASRVAADVTAAKAGLNAPGTTLEVVATGGKIQKLKFGGDAGANETYLSGALDELVYVAPTAERSTFAKGVELFAPPPPPPDFGQMGQMKGLEQLPPDVRMKLMEQLRQQQRN